MPAQVRNAYRRSPGADAYRTVTARASLAAAMFDRVVRRTMGV
jgi:hypothetical protein